MQLFYLEINKRKHLLCSLNLQTRCHWSGREFSSASRLLPPTTTVAFVKGSFRSFFANPTSVLTSTSLLPTSPSLFSLLFQPLPSQMGSRQVLMRLLSVYAYLFASLVLYFADSFWSPHFELSHLKRPVLQNLAFRYCLDPICLASSNKSI